jgi:TIR domain
MMKKGSKVFFSYAKSDQDPARKVADQLREAGFQIWDPDREILPGADWTAELKMALDSAEAVVVFISPEAIASRWVSHEIEYALGAKHLRGRLIPVMVHPTEDAPWILNSLESVRYQGPSKTGRQIVELLSQSPNAPEAKPRAS